MLSPGSVVGNVKIGNLLGRGAMGEVYSGEQISLRRPVAIKRIASHLADDEDIIHRFAREAQVVALINSPHVVAVYEFGKFIDDDKDEHYLIVMELVDGGFDLKACVGSEMTWQQASSVIMQVSEGLAAAVEHDIIHRDIKPDNIMLSKKGIAKLADFGLAKSVDSTAMTMQGTLMGTPNYMPPEACRGEEVDARGDIYSLGATWYHLLSGRSLFTAANTMALLRAHCDDDPQPISELVPGLPQELADLVMSCVAKEPEDRPQSADILHQALLKIEGVPHKVPELIRLIKSSQPEKEPGGDSTMATVATGAGIGASATAATIVTGQYANNADSTEAETFVAEQDFGQRSGQHSGQPSGPHDGGATLDNSSADSVSATATAHIGVGPGENENTLMPSTSSTEKMLPPKKSSSVPLIAVAVLVVAGVGGYFAIGFGDVENPKKTHDIKQSVSTAQDDPVENTLKTAVTPMITVVDEVPVVNTDAIGAEKKRMAIALALQTAVDECSAAIAKKEFTSAQKIYVDVSALSEDHKQLSTKISAGIATQDALMKQLAVDLEAQDFTALDLNLKMAHSYPDLDKGLQKYQTAVTQMKQQQQADSLARSIAVVDAAIEKKTLTDARDAYAALSKNSGAQKDLLTRLVGAEISQKKIADRMSQHKKNGYYMLLSRELAAAEGWFDLQSVVQTYRADVQKKTSAVISGLKSIPGLIAQKKWKKAETVLDGIGEDPRAIGETATTYSQGQRAALVSAAADEMNQAVALAIAAVGDGKSAQAKEYIAGCRDAAEVSGQKQQWQAKATAIKNIIDGKN